MDDRLKALVRAGDGALAFDDRQRIVFCNEAAGNILGYEAKAILGQSSWMLFKGCSLRGGLPCLPGCREFQQLFSGHSVAPFRIDAFRQGGDRLLLEVSVVFLPGNELEQQTAVLIMFCRQHPATNKQVDFQGKDFNETDSS
jgi:PAS domain-containing protein